METANSNFGGEVSNANGCRKPIKPILGVLLTGGVANIAYKKRMKAYEDCMNAKNAVSTGPVPGSGPKLPTPEKTQENVPEQTRSTNQEPVEEKLLGMPKKVAFVVIGLGVLALAFGGYKAFQHFNK